MPVGKNSLERAAESAAAAKKKKTVKVEKPKTDVEAMPTEVLNEEMVPSMETSRPAEFPVPDLPLPGEVSPVGDLNAKPDPDVPGSVPMTGGAANAPYSIGMPLPPYLL